MLQIIWYKWSVKIARLTVQKQAGKRMVPQKWYCSGCRKYQQKEYKYHAYTADILEMIPKLVCNGVGIRGISRILVISPVTVIKCIKQIATSIAKPLIPLNRECYEIDELRTFVGHKKNEYWIAYVLCSKTRQVIDFIAGKRNKRTLRMIVNTAVQSGVSKIKTDRLNIYQSLIPPAIHESYAYNINYIERNNLNLRTHLKRLGRRTICFSKNTAMLSACLKIYFWFNHQKMPLSS